MVLANPGSGEACERVVEPHHGTGRVGSAVIFDPPCEGWEVREEGSKGTDLVLRGTPKLRPTGAWQRSTSPSRRGEGAWAGKLPPGKVDSEV